MKDGLFTQNLEYHKGERITEEQVEWWIGSDHLSSSELIELLTQLINGEYTIPNFRADVLEFSEDTNHA